jgi:hypothetical protein
MTVDSRAAFLAATLAENSRLSAELAQAQDEAKDARAQLLSSQSSMQKEFASLWMAVQELNKLDAVKEHALAQVVAEKDHLQIMLSRAEARNDELRGEIAAMDAALQVAVHSGEKRAHTTPRLAKGHVGPLSRTASKATPSSSSSSAAPGSTAAHFAAFFPSPSPPPPPATKHELPAPASAHEDEHESTPHTSVWKARPTTPSQSPVPQRHHTPSAPSPTTAFSARPGGGLSPNPSLDQDGESALDRQLTLLSKFLENDKSALRIQQLRERTRKR